ncbi:P-loop NTPase fold protein [Arthrobacter sp. B3I9]|uniref:P-loop NTPase fold protein n=1 Tax=Arthrobacter sp. B3I9 TaxID=3042270 RepID=UPI0027D7FBD9|nr:P-loop NTPase fold protein [Arthrobacter sp. B3I9]
MITSRPWQLDVDAVVVSAAPSGGLGNLGKALRDNVRGVLWPDDDVYSLSPDLPQVVPVSTSADAPGLKWVILASARETDSSRKDPSYVGPGTPDAAGRGMASAMRKAIERGVNSLAVPLLGAGAIGLPLEIMAAVNVRAVRKSLAHEAPSSLQRVMFVGLDQRTIDAIRTAWKESELEEPVAPTGSPATTDPGEFKYRSDGDFGQVAEATRLAGGISRDLVDAGERIPLRDDHLGVGTYVTMLATVIANRQTPLPLSVGLFGEWGSGKSYFMGLLRGQVDNLAGSGDEAYVDNVVPITFNAWHYADTNLWASLGNEIFEQLAGPQATAAERREALREELADKLQRAQELRLANEQAERETARLRQELEQARSDAAGSAAALARSVAASPTLRKEWAKIWRRLGVREEAEKGQLLAGEIRQAGAEVSALKLVASGRRGLVAALAAAVALGLLAASLFFRDEVARWLAGSGLTGLAVALTWMTVAVGQVRAGLGLLRTVAGEIRKEIKTEVDEKVTEDMQELRRADAREAVLQSQLVEVLQRAGELGGELAQLSPGQRWYGFVSARASSDEYRRELSLISTIRRDFEHLIELMQDWRSLKDPDEQHRPIDRIVLYIDDLDRCSPRQVVDVLQAVHLLLALDLFVVVVGVDPRWLLHSLREQYASVFRGREDGRLPEHPDLPDDEAVWRTTPHDYLEKIFNIPFVLPGMTGTSFERLIRKLSLAEDARVPEDDRLPYDSFPAEAGSEVAAANAGPEVTTANTGPEGTTANTGPDGTTANTGPLGTTASTGAKPAPRQLSEDELKLLAALGPLVRSPRQAKRLLNLYRLVRSTRDLSPASAFLGSDSTPGQFQAVGLLLGLLTAYPRLLGQLIAAVPGEHTLGGLCSRQPTESWRHVVEGLRPRSSDGRWSNDVSDDLSDEDRREWEELVQRVGSATALVTLSDLRAFQLWAPRVTRFSFILSPLVVQEAQSGPGTD